MSRPLLSIYRLDRSKLADFSHELRDVLSRDDRSGLASLIGLGQELAARVTRAHWAIDLMLRPDDDEEVAPIFASLRRVAKRRAIEQVWTSQSPSLEGRLRAYDVLRDDEDVARRIDRLLEAARLPWFLQRPGGTAGWLDDAERAELANGMEGLGPALPDEVNAFVEVLGGISGDVLVHDRL